MNKRMLQRGSHHAILAIVVVVGLVGVLGFVGYNSWKKQSAGAAGIGILGRGGIKCVKAPCDGNPIPVNTKSNGVRENFVFTFGSYPNTKHYAYNLKTGATKVLDASKFTSERLGAVTPDGRAILDGTSGVMTAKYIANYDDVTYGIDLWVSKCPGVSGTQSYKRAGVIDNDLNVYYVEKKYDCSGSMVNPALVGGTIKKVTPNKVVTSEYPSVTDVDELLTRDESGILYRDLTPAGWGYVTTDATANVKIKFKASYASAMRGQGAKKITYQDPETLYTRSIGATNQAPTGVKTLLDRYEPTDAQPLDGGDLFMKYWGITYGDQGTSLHVRTPTGPFFKVAEMGPDSVTNYSTPGAAKFISDDTIAYTKVTKVSEGKFIREVRAVKYNQSGVVPGSEKTIYSSDLKNAESVEFYSSARR